MIRINVIGLGFVGLTTITGFASKGFIVRGVENDKKKINQLKNFKIPFYEPNLDINYIENFKKKRIQLENKIIFEKKKK